MRNWLANLFLSATGVVCSPTPTHCVLVGGGFLPAHTFSRVCIRARFQPTMWLFVPTVYILTKVATPMCQTYQTNVGHVPQSQNPQPCKIRQGVGHKLTGCGGYPLIAFSHEVKMLENYVKQKKIL